MVYKLLDKANKSPDSFYIMQEEFKVGQIPAEAQSVTPYTLETHGTADLYQDSISQCSQTVGVN